MTREDACKNLYGSEEDEEQEVEDYRGDDYYFLHCRRICVPIAYLPCQHHEGVHDEA